MIPHSSDNTRYATFPLGDAENMSSSQQSANPVADMPLIWSVQPEQAPGALQQYNPTPLWSQPEQVPGALQQYRYNPNAYSQNSQMATTAPGVNLSLANSAHRNNQAFARPMSEIEWSQTSFDSWSLDNSGPAVQPQGRSFLQNDYSQHASNPGVHGQHQPRGFAAGQSLGPRGTPWNPNHQHDPASQ